MITKQGQRDLQEVYHHLDGVNGGTTRIAWYGQGRAQGMTHAEALEDTIHFDLRREIWHQARLTRDVPYLGVTS